MQAAAGPITDTAYLNLDCSGLLQATASLLQGLGQQGVQLKLQRALQLAVASAHSSTSPGDEHFTTRAICILNRALAQSGINDHGLELSATSISHAKPAAAQHAGQLAALRAAQAASKLKLQLPITYQHRSPPPTQLTAAPGKYLDGMRRTIAGAAVRQDASGGTGESGDGPVSQPGSASGRTTTDLQQLVEDAREVAAGLAVDPTDPSTCRLTLRPLVHGRTVAAVATKLLSTQQACRVKKQLLVQLQEGACKHSLHVRLLSSERALLLAGAIGGPLLHPQAALAGILREAVGQRRAAQEQQALPVAQFTAAMQQRWQQQQVLNHAVLAQHKELKKAWREKRAREQRERMAALRSNDVEEYMRLVQQGQGAKSAKIQHLLSQTDSCLRRLAARLHSAGAGQVLQATAATGGSPSLSGSPRAGSRSGDLDVCGSGIAALEQSHEAWNQLAKAFQADVPCKPKLLTGGVLREYQMEGLRWMVGLKRQGLNGILADEMGLGKTVQVIALVCHLVGELQGWRPVLIAVPSSVLPNWEAELARWAPGIKVVSYKGSAEQRETVWERQLRRGRGGGAGAGTHVVLTTYDFLMGKNDKPRLSRVFWSYLVVDEGHRLKNSGCKLNAELRSYSTQHRLLLTGTPLQNRLEELWSLLNFLMPSLFNSGDDFQEWFGGAERRGAAGTAAGAGEQADGSDDESAEAAEAAMLTEEEALIVTNRLHQVLRPFMLRRLKETVASELPQKVERLLPVLPSPYQQALFRLMEREIQGGGGGRGGLKGVNNVLMEMRNICNHPLISRLHPEGSEALLPPHSLPPEVRLCSKLELLDRLLVKLKAGRHKVLLFSTMTRALDLISDYLDWRGFRHLRMDGGTAAAERGELVSRFNDPGSDVFVFLLSIRAGGVGLNLQAADTVIMYDTDWNPQMDLQAQARAHRMGQTREVLVLRLKTVGTVEERVVGVASDKARLADRSITGGFFDGKTSAEQRQRYLLDTIRTSTSVQQQAEHAGGSSEAGEEDGGVNGASIGQLSNAQLNRLLARGESELELFEAEDRRLQEVELASWQAAQASISGGKHKSGSSGSASQAAQQPYNRLATDEEVAALVQRAQELLQPRKDNDTGLELGRGKRQRGTAAYRDMKDRDFNRLCKEGVAAGEAPVPLLAVSAAAPVARATPAPAATETGVGVAAAKRRRVAATPAAKGHIGPSTEVPATDADAALPTRAAGVTSTAAPLEPVAGNIAESAAIPPTDLVGVTDTQQEDPKPAQQQMITLQLRGRKAAQEQKQQAKQQQQQRQQQEPAAAAKSNPPAQAGPSTGAAAATAAATAPSSAATPPAAVAPAPEPDTGTAAAVTVAPAQVQEESAVGNHTQEPAAQLLAAASPSRAAPAAVPQASGPAVVAKAKPAAPSAAVEVTLDGNEENLKPVQQQMSSRPPRIRKAASKQKEKQKQQGRTAAAKPSPSLTAEPPAATAPQTAVAAAASPTEAAEAAADHMVEPVQQCPGQQAQEGRGGGSSTACHAVQSRASAERDHDDPCAETPHKRCRTGQGAAATCSAVDADRTVIPCVDGSGLADGAAAADTPGTGNKQCSNCSSQSTSGGKWRKEPGAGALLCQQCYSFLRPHKRHQTAHDIAARQAKKQQTITEVRRCTHCNTISTPQWRRHPTTRKLLCDSCGTKARHGKLPTLEDEAQAGSGVAPAAQHKAVTEPSFPPAALDSGVPAPTAAPGPDQAAALGLAGSSPGAPASAAPAATASIKQQAEATAAAGPAAVAAAAAPAEKGPQPAQKRKRGRPQGSKKGAGKRQLPAASAAPISVAGAGAAAVGGPEPEPTNEGQVERTGSGTGKMAARAQDSAVAPPPAHAQGPASGADAEPPVKRHKTEQQQGDSFKAAAPPHASADSLPAEAIQGDGTAVAGAETTGSSKQCSNCGSKSTSGGRWRKEPGKGACLCEQCYSFLRLHKHHQTAEDIAARQAKKQQAVTEERRCTHCHATATSKWRRHPTTRKLLCDSCGTKARHGKLPQQEGDGQAVLDAVPAAPALPQAVAKLSTAPPTAASQTPAAAAADAGAAAPAPNIRQMPEATPTAAPAGTTAAAAPAAKASEPASRHRKGRPPSNKKAAGKRHRSADATAAAPPPSNEVAVPAAVRDPSEDEHTNLQQEQPVGIPSNAATCAMDSPAAPAAHAQEGASQVPREPSSKRKTAGAAAAATSPSNIGAAAAAEAEEDSTSGDCTAGAKQCSNCGSESTTGGRWLKEPGVGACLCQRCCMFLWKNKRHRTSEEIAALEAKKQQSAAKAAAAKERCCAHCHITTTSWWHRHPTTRQLLCHSCGTTAKQGLLPDPQADDQAAFDAAVDAAQAAPSNAPAESKRAAAGAAAPTPQMPAAEEEDPDLAALAAAAEGAYAVAEAAAAAVVTAPGAAEAASSPDAGRPDGGTADGKQCSNCGSTTTTGNTWRKEPGTGACLCNRCGSFLSQHKRHRTAEEIAAYHARKAQGKEERCCTHCGVRNTRNWRRHPDTRKLLCNTCGTYVRTHGQLPGLQGRPKAAAEARVTGEAAAAAAASGMGAELAAAAPTQQLPATGAAAVAGDAALEPVLPPPAVPGSTADGNAACHGGGKQCSNCGSNTTTGSTWRKEPGTGACLCNKCGQFFARHGRHRSAEEIAEWLKKTKRQQ